MKGGEEGNGERKGGKMGKERRVARLCVLSRGP